MDTMQFYVIQTDFFGDNKNFWYLAVPLNNFAPLSYTPLVQVSLISPLPRYVCVCGRGGVHRYSMSLRLFLVS